MTVEIDYRYGELGAEELRVEVFAKVSDGEELHVANIEAPSVGNPVMWEANWTSIGRLAMRKTILEVPDCRGTLQESMEAVREFIEGNESYIQLASSGRHEVLGKMRNEMFQFLGNPPDVGEHTPTAEAQDQKENAEVEAAVEKERPKPATRRRRTTK